jgi:hypothetical protein
MSCFAFADLDQDRHYEVFVYGTNNRNAMQKNKEAYPRIVVPIPLIAQKHCPNYKAIEAGAVYRCSPKSK